MNNEVTLSDLDLRKIIDTIPTALFIVDHNTRILDLNDSAARLIGKRTDKLLRRLCGDAFHCIHAKNAPGGCGTTEFCADCVIRNIANDCCSGHCIIQKRADLSIQKNNDTHKVVFSISASPFKNNEKPLAIISMEDITELVLLRDLIPICSYCKCIRKDDAYWETIEDYLHQQIGAQLSHGICPDCAKKHYPDMGLYDDE
jgi:PAS domain-containing protein